MESLFLIYLATVFSLAPSVAYSQDVPVAPPRIQEAEAKGLARVGAAELRELLHGPTQFFGEGAQGQKARSALEFNADGSVVRKSGDTTLKGTWNVDDSKNVFCTAFTFQKTGYQKNCFAVFRAPDGVHFFDYDASKGFDVHVWRPGSE